MGRVGLLKEIWPLVRRLLQEGGHFLISDLLFDAQNMIRTIKADLQMRMLSYGEMCLLHDTLAQAKCNAR